MPATNRIEATAGPDRKVGSIRRVATTSTAAEVAALKLSGSERQIMDLIMLSGGEYARSQKALAGTLGISTRTLSRAQRGLAQKGLIALRYNGRHTHYQIRLKGVETALKSASSKGYAKNGASIEYITSQKENLKKQDISAEAGGRTPPPVPQGRIQRVATPPGGLAGSAPPGAGAHPDFMRGHPPRRGWRDTPALTVGQRMVCLWKDLTGRLATAQDKGLLRAIARETQEPEKLLAWAVRHWNTVGDGVMDWADTYPAEPSLGWLRKNVGKYERAFHMEPRDLEFLASSPARTARQGWRKSHHASDWRDDDSWRDGPHAKKIRGLLIDGKDKEAKAMMHALSEAWRDGPLAHEIEDLLIGGKRKEGKALMRESNRSYFPSAEKMEWLAAGEKVTESWRIGPHARDIRRLLARGKRKEAEALMIKDFGNGG